MDKVGSRERTFFPHKSDVSTKCSWNIHSQHFRRLARLGLWLGKYFLHDFSIKYYCGINLVFHYCGISWDPPVDFGERKILYYKNSTGTENKERPENSSIRYFHFSGYIRHNNRKPDCKLGNIDSCYTFSEGRFKKLTVISSNSTPILVSCRCTGLRYRFCRLDGWHHYLLKSCRLPLCWKNLRHYPPKMEGLTTQSHSRMRYHRRSSFCYVCFKHVSGRMQYSADSKPCMSSKFLHGIR